MTPAALPNSPPARGLITDGWTVFGTMLTESLASGSPRPMPHGGQARAIKRWGLRGLARRLLVWWGQGSAPDALDSFPEPRGQVPHPPATATDASIRLDILMRGGFPG